MAKQETKGNIGVTSENIFPVIKKFLYSDHEIFLRELVSNAIDATQKLKTLASVSAFAMLDGLRQTGRLRPGQRILLMVPESARFSYSYALLTVV